MEYSLIPGADSRTADTHGCLCCLLSPHPRAVSMPSTASTSPSVQGHPRPAPGQSSPAELQLQSSASPGTCASTGSLLQQLQGTGEASGVESTAECCHQSFPIACMPGQMDAQRFALRWAFPPALTIFHGRTTHLTALRNSLEEQHPKEGTSQPAPGWLPLASRQ